MCCVIFKVLVFPENNSLAAGSSIANTDELRVAKRSGAVYHGVLRPNAVLDFKTRAYASGAGSGNYLRP